MKWFEYRKLIVYLVEAATKKPKTTATKINEPGKLVSKAKVKETEQKTPEKTPEKPAEVSQNQNLQEECKKSIEAKMKWILSELDKATQLGQISELLDLLQKCHGTLQLLQK